MNAELAQVIDEATAEAKKGGHGTIEFAHIWSALLRTNDAVADRYEPPDPPLGDQLKELPQTWETPTIGADVAELFESLDTDGGGLDRLIEATADRVHATERPGSKVAASASSGQTDTAAPVVDASATTSGLDPNALRAALRGSLLGQDHAIETVVRRLALTRRSFDLRPERPDGVFFFAGPTGVGKTYLAELLSEELYGPGSLIRLDMSEYMDPTAVNRLIGPQPGYVGYDQPDSWLTTKMIKAGSAVVLLDEVEKSHPVVWNTFLQLFDSGRLTDARGKTADFSSAVIILTSNLGSSELAGTTGFGFAGSGRSNDGAITAVTREVERILPIELVNRLDDIVVFNVLGDQMIEGIARQVLDDAFERVRGTYEIEISPDLLASVVNALHDARFGARHVHRIIEEQVLQPLVLEPPGAYRAEFHGTTCTWVAAAAEGGP